jgi:hypothetical protein
MQSTHNTVAFGSQSIEHSSYNSYANAVLCFMNTISWSFRSVLGGWGGDVERQKKQKVRKWQGREERRKQIIFNLRPKRCTFARDWASWLKRQSFWSIREKGGGMTGPNLGRGAGYPDWYFAHFRGSFRNVLGILPAIMLLPPLAAQFLFVIH